MSCLDVMYHQNYGVHHYLPATAAAAYKAAYFHHYHHHHHHQQQQQQQQKKFSAYSRMSQSVDPPAHFGQRKQAEKRRAETELEREVEQDGEEEIKCKEPQPAEAEYLSSRCVLFTYFHGDIGDVVDEHFTRALSQSSAFGSDKSNSLISGVLWKDGSSPSDSQCVSLASSLWSSSYPSQSSPSIPSVHADFPAGASFHSAETNIWSAHSVTQAGLPSTAALTDSWPYGLGGQSGTGYPHVHEMYPHMHARHAHPHAHPHSILHHSHSTGLDHRFSPFLLPGMRSSCSPSSSNTEGIKTELEPTTSWPASFQGSVDIYDAALEQDKAKASAWF